MEQTQEGCITLKPKNGKYYKMKNKKLRQTTLINLIAGYMTIVAFALLILFNRAPEAQVSAAAPDSKVYADDLFDGVHEDDLLKERFYVEGHPVDHIQVVDRGVGKDYGAGIIFNNDAGVLLPGDHIVNDVVVTRSSVHVTPNHRSSVIVGHDDRSIIHGGNRIIADRETIIADNDLIYENHHTNDLLLDRSGFRGDAIRGNGRGHRASTGRNIEDIEDRGILDRRLADLNEGSDKASDSETNRRPNADSNDLTGLELAEGENPDLELDINEFNPEKPNPKGYGSKGGELYAYNFPSQGVGAGIGSGAVGAGAGSSAGIGGGIGEAVLGGKTVPTLGGVGTYRSVPTVPPGTGSDGDNDGLEVEAELALGTDPTKSDSDGDGYSDGEEITSYTNPSDPTSNPGSPGSMASPTMGGVGGLVGGAGAGGAAGLITGMVKPQLGVPGVPAPGCAECEGECKGHGHGHGKHEYDLPPDGALHIMMHVDGSGSILNTRKQLEIMKDTLLKDALLPYYNNNEKLYNKRVTIVDGNGERTLQFFAEATKKDNVLAVVFQDEAQPAYHLPTFNKKPQDHYSKDLQKLKGGLNGYGGLYRGIMFQVDRGRTFAKSFKEFVESAWQGTGYLKNSNLKKYYWEENRRSIEGKDGVVFSDEYHAKDSGDPEYYLKLILDASRKVGLDLRAKGAGLTDGKYNKKASSKITN
jgi:hypothetical protein